MNQPEEEEKIGEAKIEIKAQAEIKPTKEEFEAEQVKKIEQMGKKSLTVRVTPKPKGRRAQRAAARERRQAEAAAGEPIKDEEEIPSEESPAQNEEQTPETSEEQEAEDAQEEAQQPEQQEAENQTEEQSEEEQQRLKLIDRFKKGWNNLKNKIKEYPKQIASKFTKDVLKKLLLALLKSPYFWVILLVIILLMVLMSSCSRQSGKTPYQPLDPKQDKNLVLQFRAAAGEKAAQRELIADQAIEAKKALDEIKTDHAEAKTIIDQIKKLLDDIVALAGNEAAVKEKIKQIIALLDKLKSLLPDYATKIDEIKNKVSAIGKLIDYYQKGHLVVNPKDLDYARNYDLDRRVVQMLVYLVTPRGQGGAGHERLKVNRIKFSYDSERKSPSKETEYAETEEPNISAHFSGQAADITEIDYIKCTEIKRRRLLKDKKRPLPAIPIKVAWQSEKGYLLTGGPEAFGQNMHDLFKNLGAGAVNDLLIAEIADALGIELDPTKLQGKSWGEITKYIGTAYLKAQLDIPGDYELGSDPDDIAKNIGRAYLADALGVPIEGVYGNSEEEIMENIGRAILEERMGLPAGSLVGKTSEEIFSSAGRRKMEESLGLSRDSLSISYTNNDGFIRAVGQGRLEASLSFRPRTFYGGSIEEVKKRVGKEMFEYTFANPEMIDNWLGIGTGSTEKLVSGELSPDAYNSLVGESVLKQEFYVYQDPQKRAEAFDVSRADLDALVAGNQGAFAGMGKYTIAKAFTASDPERDLFISWFNTKTKPANLDADYLGGQRGLRPGDIEKIFVDNLASEVFRRLGKVEVIDNLEDNPELAQYLEPVKEIRFYTDRVNIIEDNFRAIKNNSQDPEIRAKAQEAANLAGGLLSEPSMKTIKSKLKTFQEDLKFIEDRAPKNDPQTLERIRAIRKAINEIIEGREINDFSSYSADSINSKTNPQIGLTKKDILAVLTGKKKLDDLVVNIGMAKWETELDLPQGSLTEIYQQMKTAGFASADETILISIGKAKVKEYPGFLNNNAQDIDRDLGISSGTTSAFRSGKMTENAYFKTVGQAVTNGVAANLLNQQLGLDDPYYALNGPDISKLLSGGWFWVTLKLGGKAIDESLDFPPGGTLDILQQSDGTGDVLGLLAEKKLGILAGLYHPVSIEGDIVYNLGRVRIEEELWLKPNEINDNNLADKINEYTGGNQDSLSRLDASFSLSPGESKKLLSGSTSSHDYIVHVGNHLKDSVIYDTLANFAPDLKNKDLKYVALALAEKTGSPQEILEQAGANRIAEMLGLDYPVSIRGNFKDNLGEGKIEDRLGLKTGSFKDNIDAVVQANGQERFEAAFYIERGKLSEARQGDSAYWQDEYHKNDANLIDAILNIPSNSTFAFLTGKLALADYIDRAGRSTLTEVTAGKLVDFMGLDDNYRAAAVALVNVFNTDPSLSSPSSKQKLFNALMGVAGLDLDSKTGFTPGTWQRILFVDPKDPEHTGLKNADSILLEEGKKWVPKMLGMDAQWDPYMDLIYEQASGLRDLEAMKDAIKETTGIPDDADAYRLLKGDLKGGLYAWGASQIVKAYNEEFKNTDSRLDYYTVRDVFFNTPEFDQKVGDEAVAKFKQECGGCDISPEMEQSIRDDAIHEAKTKLQRELQYAIVDMQLHAMDKNIPPGFTKAMREGTPEEKWTMGLTYIGNIIHSENPNIPPEILNDLQKYYETKDPSSLSSSTLSYLDTQMKVWFGGFIQPGTAKALFEFGKTGKLGSPSDQGSLTQIYADYGINIICNWGDAKMGLPMGTTKLIYDYYTKYQAAIAEYRAAQAAYAAGKITKEALLTKETAAQQLKAEFISFVVTKVFTSQLRSMEEKLGLVPGSADLLVSATVQYLMSTGDPILTLAIFVAWNLFGVYRVDVLCSACGYYPDGGDAGAGWWGGVVGKILFPDREGSTANVCPLGEFDGVEAGSFRQGTIAAAQWKVNQLLGEVLRMDEALKDENMLPTQIMTLRQEDVDSYADLLNEKYGPPASRGNSGLWANELMWAQVHIGY